MHGATRSYIPLVVVYASLLSTGFTSEIVDEKSLKEVEAVIAHRSLAPVDIDGVSLVARLHFSGGTYTRALMCLAHAVT